MRSLPYRCLPMLLIVWGCLAATPLHLHGQARGDDYFIANQLFQQRKYDQAFELFLQLHEQHPGTYLFFDKATECLINLKNYNRAAQLSREAVKAGRYPTQARIRLGEIQHFRGDTTMAYDTWQEVKEDNPKNLQVHLSLARAMRDRRAFSQSIATYREAAQIFNKNSMVSNELAHTYLLAGKYEESVRQYLQLLKDNPDRIGFVQTKLLRFDDDYLFDIAILEIGEFLKQLSPTHPSRQSLQQLEVWLLMERGLHKRALSTAKNYEKSDSRITYTLYSLGSKLMAEKKFQLAEEAFSHYVTAGVPSAKYQSLEKLAQVYTRWAGYLENYNLAFKQKRDSLNRAAFSTLRQILQENSNYHNLERVLIQLADLALDHLHNPRQAQRYLHRLEQQPDSSNLAYRAYIQGRLHLYDRQYAQARLAFTKSNRQERIGSLAEKTRYFLALTDFFSGDYEFAKIQLNALERQTTSYFANDALQLRVWIQEGLEADSTGGKLQPFAKAMEYYSQGQNTMALNELADITGGRSSHPLADEALLEMSLHISPESAPVIYRRLERYLSDNGRYSPLHERLLWEKARIADQAVIHKQNNNNSGPGREQVSPYPSSVEKIIALYETIILEYPTGFYADFARNRIQELQEIQT